ncbi:unnamed protein product [Arabis nemorensis]|uniref:holo-[acyl-carrier-protein] synthase n=1 Tax=Arabis nemorensis TaxID=586526 RepID=A0A565AUS6_9BRAS|nr:unnamed protein product [Arabis nemorensis]
MRGHELKKNALLARGPPLLDVDWQNHKKCNNPPLHFNLSHTDSLIACGVTVHVPLHCITTVDPEVQRKQFIKLWTLKEAYVKVLGKGFSAAPFYTFTIQSKAGTGGGYNLCEVCFRLKIIMLQSVLKMIKLVEVQFQLT